MHGLLNGQCPSDSGHSKQINTTEKFAVLYSYCSEKSHYFQNSSFLARIRELVAVSTFGLIMTRTQREVYEERTGVNRFYQIVDRQRPGVQDRIISNKVILYYNLLFSIYSGQQRRVQPTAHKLSMNICTHATHSCGISAL